MEQWKIEIILKECLEDYINSFGEVDDDIKTTIGSPGGRNLFKVNEDLDRLEVTKAEMFNHIVAKLLFVSKKDKNKY